MDLERAHFGDLGEIEIERHERHVMVKADDDN